MGNPPRPAQPRHSGSRGLGLGPGLPQQELGDHGLRRNAAGDAALRGSAPAQHGPPSQDSKHISEIESCVTDSFNFILSRTLASVAGRETGQLSSRAMQVGPSVPGRPLCAGLQSLKELSGNSPRVAGWSKGGPDFLAGSPAVGQRLAPSCSDSRSRRVLPHVVWSSDGPSPLVWASVRTGFLRVIPASDSCPMSRWAAGRERRSPITLHSRRKDV